MKVKSILDSRYKTQSSPRSSAGDACSLIRSHRPTSRVGDESFPTKTCPKEEIMVTGSISGALTFDQPSGRTDLVSLGNSATAGSKSAQLLAALKWIHIQLS